VPASLRGYPFVLATNELKGAPVVLAYAQMFSVGQQSQLTERAMFQIKYARSSVPLEDLEGLFGDDGRVSA